jgi:hypothetical protein
LGIFWTFFLPCRWSWYDAPKCPKSFTIQLYIPSQKTLCFKMQDCWYIDTAILNCLAFSNSVISITSLFQCICVTVHSNDVSIFMNNWNRCNYHDRRNHKLWNPFAK